MTEEYTERDFENLLCLRNELINASTSQMMEEYQDFEQYMMFLDTVLILLDTDSGFLLLDDEYSDKIFHVIQIHRFDCKDKDIRDAINLIIDRVNQTKSYSKELKEMILKDYQDYQSDLRSVEFSTQEDLIYALGYDAIVFLALKDDRMDIATEDDVFLSSVNYMMEVIPEFFSDDEISNRLEEHLQVLMNRGWPFPNQIRKYSKHTKEAFQMMKKRG